MDDGADFARSDDPDLGGAAERPTLPYAKAFVVQFTAETDPRLEHAAGRIEHLQTGRQSRFTSIEDLLPRLAALLAEANEAGGPARSTARGGGQGARSAIAAQPRSEPS